MSFIGNSPTVALIVVAFAGCWIAGIAIGLIFPSLGDIVALIPIFGVATLLLGMMGWRCDRCYGRRL
jgi:4-amino-4-deoxy-L-arabinose transferase-like glycosyltransferase